MTPPVGKIDVYSADAARAGVATFFNIAEVWNLTPAQQMQLLAVRTATYNEWRKHPDRIPGLDRDTITRLSYLLGIYKALQTLFPTAERSARWIHAPNHAKIFDGRSALERMLDGQLNDLHVVREYLDAMRGGKA